MGAVDFMLERRVAAPPAEVFARLVDIEAYNEWMPRKGSIRRRSEQTSTGNPAVGTTYVDHTRMGRFVGEVTEHVPATRIAFSETLSWFDRPLTRARPSYVLEADGDSTVVHHVAEGELYGPMRLLKPVAAWMATRERTHTVASLERSLEGE